MKKIHDKLLNVLDDIRNLAYAVSRHNPGIEANDLESLPALAATMRNLGTVLSGLGLDTLAIHERKQVEDS